MSNSNAPDPLHDYRQEEEPFEDIWEQWEDESDLWYGRFRLYLEVGPGRKIGQAIVREHYLQNPDAPAIHASEVQRIYRNAGWFHKSAEWRWRERAAAYDKHQEKLADEADLNERLRARAVRRTLMSDFGDQLHKMLPKLATSKPSWNGAALGLKVLTESSREEFDDKPVTRTEATITVKEIQQLTLTIIEAFNEVNTIDDPEQRRETFAKRLEAISIPDSSAVA